MYVSRRFSIAPDLRVVFYGGTGQAIVNRDILELQGGSLTLVVDDTVGMQAPFDDVPLALGWNGFQRWRASYDGPFGFSICIGNPHGRLRVQLAKRLAEQGGIPLLLVHPSAVVATDCQLGAGSQIMAGAVVQPRVVVGAQCIINTRASVDHECRLADGVEIGPGATLCGSIQVQAGAWIGAGATVLPRCQIGADAIVGAGCLVRADVESKTIVVGVPAQVLRRKDS